MDIGKVKEGAKQKGRILRGFVRFGGVVVCAFRWAFFCCMFEILSINLLKCYLEILCNYLFSFFSFSAVIIYCSNWFVYYSLSFFSACLLFCFLDFFASFASSFLFLEYIVSFCFIFSRLVIWRRGWGGEK